jgi:hypothetical protein
MEPGASRKARQVRQVRQVRPAGLPWGIRAVQLDLARHMETVGYVRRYTDLAAGQGFNTLVLYLEARVRTKSFPFRSRQETYSLEEMAEIVAHARHAGMDVVPVVSTLGHCEQFLACRELAPLAEQRSGRGRFGAAGPSIFCPSLEETYDFFAGYFAELAQVFPAPHWHAGLDEDWDMGYCDLCRVRWKKESLGGIFIDHLWRVHGILRGLGKRMWMWDDMFELFPEELVNLPKDIVLCHWQYDELIEPEGIQAHFTNRARRDWLGQYAKLGLSAIVCPVSASPRNIETFTNYARRHQVLGGLLTQWEGSPRFHAGNSAILAFTGRLWNQRRFAPEEALEHGVRTVLPHASPATVAAAKELIRMPRLYPRASVQDYLYGRMAGEEVARRSAVRLAQIPQNRGPGLARAERDFLDHLEWSARMELLHWDLRELIPAIYDPRRPAADLPELKRRAGMWRRQLAELLRQRKAHADRLGLHDHPSDARDHEHWRRLAANLEPAWQRLKHPPAADDWWAVLRLFLQDFYGAPKLKVTVSAGTRRTVIAEGTFKPPSPAGERTGGHYTLMVPFRSRAIPDAIRLEAWGYGSQGVAFVELQNPTTTLVPRRLRKPHGLVTAPEAVLADDSACATLGCPAIAAAIHDPALAERHGMLDIALGPP